MCLGRKPADTGPSDDNLLVMIFMIVEFDFEVFDEALGRISATVEETQEKFHQTSVLDNREDATLLQGQISLMLQILRLLSLPKG